MISNSNQSKNHEVVATQEMITAQNSANQGKKNFDGTNKLFNAVDEAELKRALSRYDFGIVRPEYIITNLKMAQRLVDRARMSDEQKSVLRNSYGFLLAAICSENGYEDYEYIAQRNYPEDLEDLTFGEDEEFGSKEELLQDVEYELSCLFSDWDYTYEDFNLNPKDWSKAKEIAEAYIDVLNQYDIETPDWVYKSLNDIDKHFAEYE